METTALDKHLTDVTALLSEIGRALPSSRAIATACCKGAAHILVLRARMGSRGCKASRTTNSA